MFSEVVAAKRPVKTKQSPLASISSPDDEEELRLVMQEIADALGAIAIVLTTQDDDDYQSQILRMSETILEDYLIYYLHEEDAFIYDESTSGAHKWKSVALEESKLDILIMPVNRMIGHQRMVISAIFCGVGEEARMRAERAYLARRPFAIGYFRLWQIDRVRQKRETALEAALNSFGVGTVLLDLDSNIVFANDAAQHLFLLGDGLKLVSNRVQATSLKDAVRLRTVLDHVTATGLRKAPMLSIARASKLPLIVLAMPIEWEERDIGTIAAVVYIIDPAANITAVLEPLCRLYQLTASETKLACLLVTGTSLVEAAGKLRVKEQTARTVLKQIFRKTGTARQGELIMQFLMSIQRAHHPVEIEVI